MNEGGGKKNYVALRQAQGPQCSYSGNTEPLLREHRKTAVPALRQAQGPQGNTIL